MTSNGNTENHVLRWLCAVLVMCVPFIHYNPDISVGGHQLWELIYDFGRFAMPVFFLVSGYFLYSDDGHSESRLKQKTLHILCLFVFIKVLYLAVDSVLCATGNFGPDPGNSFEWARDPWGHVLYNFILFGEEASHVWFAGCLAVIYAAHWLFYRTGADFRYLVPFGVLFLLLNLVIGEFFPYLGISGFFGIALGDFMAGMYVTIGLFFFQTGYYIHKYRKTVDASFSTAQIIAILIAGIALSVAEIILMLDTGVYEGTASVGPSVYVGTVFAVLALFVLTFRIGGNKLRCRPLEWLGKNTLPWLYAYIGLGVILSRNVILYGYRDDPLIFEMIGPFLAVLIQVAAALVTYWVLKTISERRTP